MPKTRRIKIYSFEELNEAAKQHAMEEWRKRTGTIDKRTFPDSLLKDSMKNCNHEFLVDGRLA